MLLTALTAVRDALTVGFHAFWGVFVLIWWVVIPLALFFAFSRAWLFYKEERFKNDIKWVLLELTAPREVPQTAKAMEQVFATVHGMYSFGVSFYKKWFKGVVEQWASFEVAGRAGAVHFYIRIPEGYRDMIESVVYAHYPDVEISLVPDEDDYVRSFPADLPNEEYTLFGSELALVREDGYPLRTYPEFEEREEERRVDPIGAITEVMSRLERSEAAWIQILIRPTGTEWTKKAQEVIDIVLGKKKPEKKMKFSEWAGKQGQNVGEFGQNLLKAPFVVPEWGGGKEEKKEEKGGLTEGNKRIIEAVEHKMSKIGFEGGIRFVYIDRKDAFTGSNSTALMGVFRQFSTLNLNALGVNKETMTTAKQPFKNLKTDRKRRKLYAHYRARDFVRKFNIYNAEELATLFHFPITGVKSPMLQRIEARKSSPPADLPSF